MVQDIKYIWMETEKARFQTTLTMRQENRSMYIHLEKRNASNGMEKWLDETGEASGEILGVRDVGPGTFTGAVCC